MKNTNISRETVDKSLAIHLIYHQTFTLYGVFNDGPVDRHAHIMLE